MRRSLGVAADHGLDVARREQLCCLVLSLIRQIDMWWKCTEECHLEKVRAYNE